MKTSAKKTTSVAKVQTKVETKKAIKTTILKSSEFSKLKESLKSANFNLSNNLDSKLTETKESSSKYAINIKNIDKSKQKQLREEIRKNFLKIVDFYILKSTNNKLTETDKKQIISQFQLYCKVFLITDKKAITKDFIHNVVYCAIGQNKLNVDKTKVYLISVLNDINK